MSIVVIADVVPSLISFFPLRNLCNLKKLIINSVVFAKCCLVLNFNSYLLLGEFLLNLFSFLLSWICFFFSGFHLFSFIVFIVFLF